VIVFLPRRVQRGRHDVDEETHDHKPAGDRRLVVCRTGPVLSPPGRCCSCRPTTSSEAATVRRTGCRQRSSPPRHSPERGSGGTADCGCQAPPVRAGQTDHGGPGRGRHGHRSGPSPGCGFPHRADRGLPVSPRAMDVTQLVVSELGASAREYAPGPVLLPPTAPCRRRPLRRRQRRDTDGLQELAPPVRDRGDGRGLGGTCGWVRRTHYPGR
jgi:hypothetical protein